MKQDSPYSPESSSSGCAGCLILICFGFGGLIVVKLIGWFIYLVHTGVIGKFAS